MPNVIWKNLTEETVTWAAVMGSTLHKGQLAPQQTYQRDRSGVDFAGWEPESFTGLMLVSIPRSAAEHVVVYASTPEVEVETLLSELKLGS